MTFRVLELGDQEWLARVAALPSSLRDIHFDQRMLAPYVAAFGWRAGLACTVTDVSDNQYVIQPFLITHDGELRHAYNFGGPVASSPAVSTYEHFDRLDGFAADEGVTKQYCTLVPFICRHQLALLGNRGLLAKDYHTKYIKDVVYIDLSNVKLRGTTRRAATKAKKAGVVVKSYDYTYLGKFYEMYQATMDRHQAKDHWYLPYKWFETFCRFVKPDLLLAYFEGKVQAGCLVAGGARPYETAYYHFAGSYNDYPNLGINHLLVLSASECAKSKGARILCLGGAASSSDDGLFLFKSGFSELRASVYTYDIAYAKKAKEEAA